MGTVKGDSHKESYRTIVYFVVVTQETFDRPDKVQDDRAVVGTQKT